MTRRGGAPARLLLAALVCAATFLHGAMPAQAEKLSVCPSGCDFATIAAALQDAGNGDVIDIGEGTYDGGVVVTKDVTLRGAGRDRTTIRGTSQASVIRLGKAADVRIQAVTITGGGGSPNRFGEIAGGGILNEGGLVLSDSIVRGNAVVAGDGGGIYSHSSKPVKIIRTEMLENQARDGGGVYVHDGDVVMENTTIKANRGTRTGGGIVFQGGGVLRLEDCDVDANRADFSVGGIYAGSDLEIVDSGITGNSATNTGGIESGRELVKIVRSLVSGNTSRGNGGGIRVGRGGVLLVDTTVATNQAGGSGGGIAVTLLPGIVSGEITLRNSTVSGNTAAQNGGGILNDQSEITLNNSEVIDNQAGGQGGGIYSRIVKKGLVKVREGSVVSGNQPDQCFPLALKCRAS